MKKVTLIVAVFTLICVLSPFAGAQLNDQAVWKANIPYAFHIENQRFPAGEYLLRWNSGRMQITSPNGEYKAFLITFPKQGKATEKSSHLEFTSYGTEYFLTGVKFAGQEEGREILKSKQAIELAKHQTGTQLAVVIVK